MMPTRPRNATRVDRSRSADCAKHGDNKQTLDFLTDAYGSQLTICSVLENIADELPEPPHHYISQTLIAMLNGSWSKQIIEEEEKLFTFLERHNKQNIFVSNLLNRLRVDRQSDSDLASELVWALEAVLQKKSVRDPEAFGYMLRSVFETKRRQVELKKAVILPMAAQILSSLG